MRKAAAPPPPPSGFQNGHGSVSTDDSDSLSGESLEGSMELTIELPIGKSVRMSVEKRTAMMDLLIQIAKANGLSPASYVLDVRNENTRDSMLFKPNTPIGSLTTSTIYVIPKSSIRDPSGRQNMKSGSQPFEKTFRLTVLLPRNQLFVQRVSQNTPLIDIFHTICSERELNPSKYEFRHPVHTEERLDLQRCLADYGLSEVAMVAVKGPNSAFSRSSSDIMALQREDDRKKSRLFGFMYRKSKSASKSLGSDVASSDGHSSRGVSPARSDGSGRHSVSPPSSTAGFTYVNGASKTNTKKRAAPVPPQAQLSKNVAPKYQSPLSENNSGLASTTSHSRHSSDSSGYHEASILSESPESTLKDLECPPSGFKMCTVSNKNSVSSSTLPSVNSTNSLSSATSGPKKRKAPAPPPPRPVVDSTPVSSQEPSEQLSSSNSSVIENEVKEVKRQDSNSSHTSISSEKAPALSSAAKSTPIPVPLPRTSKSPVDSKQINDRQNENELAEVSYESDNDVQLKDVEESSDDEDNETINTDIIKVQHVVHTDSSESEDAKVIKDISLTLHDKNLSPAETTLVVSSLQESEIDVQHYPADEATNSPGVVDNDVANEHEESVPLDKVDEFSDNLDSLPSSLALSRRSSGENREDEDGLPLGFESQMTSDVQREVDGEDLNDDLDEDNTIVESETFSIDERDSSDKNDDLTSAENSDLFHAKTEEMSGLNLSSNSSVSGNSDKLDELRNIKDDVKDSEVTVLSAQVDQSISEHKIAAEIEEAFASIDLMENGSDDSEVNSSLEPYESKDVDEVIKWDEMPQTSKANNNVELPLLKSAKDTTDSPRQKFTDELQSQNSSRAGSIKLEEPTRIERKIENAPTERAPDDVQKDISRRVVYQKPVVNFSISSYKSRVEDDDCYHHKTVKTEDVQKPIETKPVSQYRTSQIVVPSNIMNRNVSKQDVVPGQAASITKAIGTKSKNEPSSNTSSNELHDVFNRLRKTKSEIVIGNQTEVKSQNPQSEQERLQQEYTKLHHQFLQWQQQLLQNQTVLQQQNILPESSSEALQRLQELNQQFFSLPLHKQTAQKKVDGMPLDQQDYAKKTQSLPRPKSTVMPVEERGPKPSELSKAPSFGSRCWRPVSMNSWNQRSKINKEPKIEIAEAKPPQDRSNKSSLPKGSQQPRDAISQDASPSVSKVVSRMANKDNTQSKDITISQKDAPVVVPKEEGRSVSVKESVSVFNVANSSDKPVKFSRPVSQVNMFPKCPVVKGFSFEPQKTSKILITTSKKTNLNDGGSGDVQNAPTSGPQGSKPGTVRVNIGANTNVKLSSSTVNTNGVNPKSGFNTNEYMYPASKQVHVIERSNKPVVQTKTYFGDKIESRANSCNNNSETTAAQKIARTISLKTPTNYNFSSPMYSTDDNDNVKRRQNSVVSSPPPPPPPPPQENGPDTVFNYNNGTRVNKDINRPATSRTASSSSNEDFKNELMLAIRDFGGRSGLKKVSSSESDWQNRYGKLN